MNKIPTRKRYLPFFKRTISILSIISLLLTQSIQRDSSGSDSQCEDVSFLPPTIFQTYARDMNGSLLDVHTFNKFYTFQIDRPKFSNDKVMESYFQTPNVKGDGFVFRLRADLSSAYSDQVQQGMRVSLVDGEDETILTDGASVDDNEGTVKLEYMDVKPNHKYKIKYEFSSKQVSDGSDMAEVQFSATQTVCKFPFVTQELLIQDKRVVRFRAAAYKNEKNTESLSIDKLECDLGKFKTEDSAQFGEDTIFCARKLYTYDLSLRYNKPFTKDFTVKGSSNSPITYWFQVVIGYNFLTSSGLKVILTRTDFQDDQISPLECLYDKSCVEAQMSAKNELKIDVFVTTGNYRLIIYDDQSKEFSDFLKDQIGLDSIPITFRLSAYPMECKDRGLPSVTRQYSMYLTLPNQQLLHFHIQQVEITPLTDSLLKVLIKESFGVNTQIKVCIKDNCFAESTKVGTSEMLVAQLKMGTQYTVEFSYANSIISMASFFTCPHLNFELSMIPQHSLNSIVQAGQCSNQQETESNELLTSIFTSISGKQRYMFQDYRKIFSYNVDQSNNFEKKQNYIVTERNFSVDKKSTIFMEIFYEPYLYDLELYLEDTEASLVRTHITKALPNIEWTKYKGSKKIYVELEPSTYNLKIIQKVPAINEALLKFQPACVQFQLRLLVDRELSKQLIMPNSLNYFGMLGPSGKDFGQVVYFCKDCVLENQQIYYIEFTLDEGIDKQKVNFDAVADSGSNKLVLKLQPITQKMLSTNEDQSEVMKKGESTEKKSNKTKTSKGGDYQEFISKEVPSNNQKFRVLIRNVDFSIQPSISFSLRIDIQEKVFKAESAKEYLPKTIDEIQRFKVKPEGVKESEFIAGTKYMVDWMSDTSLNRPFVPKSMQTYQAKYYASKKAEDRFQLALPFRVTDEEAQVYGAVYEYTGIANLGMAIIKNVDEESDYFEVLSVPSKYHNYLYPTTLTKGDYYLVIEPATEFAYEEDSYIRFGIDFVFVKELLSDPSQDFILESIEVCDLPVYPTNLNSPQFLHPLSGYSVQFFQDYSINQLQYGDSLKFTLTQSSQLNLYVEVPKEVTAYIEIKKNKGVFKSKASTETLNEKNDIFLRQKDLTKIGVIQVREFLSAGTYEITIKGIEQSEIKNAMVIRCQSFSVGLTIAPVQNAKFDINTQCKSTQTLMSHINFDQVSEGKLSYPLSENIVDTSYFKTDSQGEGPFLFYFQVAYDELQEGSISLTLNKYDADTLAFTQAHIYQIQDSTTWLMAIIDEGTYVISIQSLTSAKTKFGVRGVSKSQNSKAQLLSYNPCTEITYSYFITSLASGDSASVVNFNLLDLIGALVSGDIQQLASSEGSTLSSEIKSDVKGINSAKCQYQDIPDRIAVQKIGYDQSYTFKVNRKQFEVIDILVDSNQFVKIHMYINNPNLNINAFLYQDSSMKNLLAYSESSKREKKLSVFLSPAKRAYKLKIVYDSFDEKDECPTYDFRLAMKPVEYLPQENLLCTGLKSPMPKIEVGNQQFYLNEQYAVSSELVEKFSKDKGFKYDIEMKLPHQNFFIDVQIGYDFLTSEINVYLFAINSKNEMFPIGTSTLEREENLQEGSVDGRATQLSKKQIRRIRVSNIDELVGSEFQGDNRFLLRIKFDKQIPQLQNFLTQKHIFNKDTEILCYPFDLKILANPLPKSENEVSEEQNEIVSVDWLTSDSSQYFDSRNRLTLYLQFKDSVKNEYNNFKQSYFLTLIPEGSENNKYPSSTRLSKDSSLVLVFFNHDVLERGTCYNINLNYNLLKVSNTITIQKLCTTNCVCYQKGTQSCDEKSGACKCHMPFTGEDCGSCMDGYVFEESKGVCVEERRCIASGGQEGCNGHGTCSDDPQSGQAICKCDPGFVHDGFDYCAKCKDPLFSYPNCAMRNWIIETSEITCENIPTKMPTYLYNSKNKTLDNETVYFQNDEGLLTWAGTYRLFPEKKQTRSYHQFMVKQNSVLRVFFDTLKSKVKLRYQILDNNKKVIQQSNPNSGYYDSDAVYEIINQPQLEKGQKMKPFTLVLDYQFDKNIEADECPVIQIYMILEPWNILQEHLKCTTDEVQASKETKQFSWEFGYQSKVINETFVLRSDQRVNDSQMVYSAENVHFYTISYNIKITESGNALSLFASYSFKESMLGMSLIDQKSGNLIAVEQMGSMQDISLELNQMNMEQDMLTFIEVPKIEAGLYEIQIMVVKGLFLPTKRFQTCLTFDLVIEYVGVSQNKPDDPSYQILSVFPAKANKMKPRKGTKIEVKFDKDLQIDDLVGESEIEKICYLEQLDSSNAAVVYPYKNLIKPANAMQLYFDFKQLQMKEEALCYTLRCSTKQNLNIELIKSSNVETKYCFQKYQALQQEIQCNPWALPKVQNNKCICSPPYTGEKCEDCVNGYIKTKDQQTGEHTVCSLDLTKCSRDICNNHGDCLTAPESAKDDQYICKCEAKYDGSYCEFCKDRKLAYPDCEEILVDIYNLAKEQKFQDKRQYNVDGYQSSAISRDSFTSPKTQCSWVNYPTDLDAIEYMDMLGGPFHIAEQYNIHHDQDNIIKFTPQTSGVIKFLAQQPQLNEIAVNDEIFDIEVGIYDLNNNKFLASSMNQILLVDEKEFNGKLEYTLLQYQVPFEYINQTLYIMFRAVNYTLTSNQELESCTQIYLELEFKENQRECQYGKMPQSSSNIITVSESNILDKSDKDEVLSVYNMQKQFFYYQDYYLSDDSTSKDSDTSYQIQLSIQQKFIEKNQIDFVVEILQSDVDYDKIEKATHKDRPICQDICQVSGQKAYNEFRNQYDLPSKTYFRLWLFQSELDGTCANFQHFMTIKPKVQEQSSMMKLLQCEEQDLPITLNTDKFLGSESKQKSFHYLERFRIDNLESTSLHRIKFTLNEPTMIRVVAPVHKHIEFDLELLIMDGLKPIRLITSAARDFEDSIYAQLKEGDYRLKLVFVSEEFYIRQPCQAIQLEIAMMPLSEVDSLNKQMAVQGNINADFTIDQVLKSEHNHLFIQKIDAIKVYDITKVSRKEISYESYITLHKSIHSLPQIKNLGALMIIQSDFLFNDVTFVLTNLKTNQIYKHSRREGLIKLILEDLPEGKYELLIYTHNCLTNINSGYLNDLTVKYSLDLNLVQWLDDEQDAVNSIQLQSMIGRIDVLDRNAFQCYEDFDSIPDNLNKYIVGRGDMSGRYLLPTVQEYTHIMNFTANDLNDMLRILLVRPKTSISVYEENIDGKPVAKSRAEYSGKRQSLLATNLKVNKKYFIVFKFQSLPNNQVFEDQFCTDFFMSIKTFSSKKDQGCSSQTLFDDFKDSISLKSQDQSQEFAMNLPKISKTILLNIQEENVDFDIIFDFSNQIYHYTIYLNKANTGERKDLEEASSIRNIPPHELNLLNKNSVISKFKNIKKGQYNILIYQQKPQDCQTKIKFTLKTYPSQDQQALLEQLSSGKIKIFQSQQEIKDQNRYVSSMPFTMDTFKFLKDETYLFISEYVSVHPKVDQNVISFSVTQDKAYLKFFLESTEINMSLYKKDATEALQSFKTNIIQGRFDKGEYQIKMDFYTEFAKKKALQTDFKIHYTMLLVSSDIQDVRYKKVQGSALSNCDGSSNFPLALKRNSDMQVSDLESTYDYPNLRLSKDTLTNKFLIDQFSFRVNETSRYFIKVGMHLVNHQITFSLTDLKSQGVTFIGKQQFNVHYIDMIVAPGDYQLTIDQPTMFDQDAPDYCGIFSFHTQITPLTLMNEGIGLITQAKCEIRETLPLKIQSSEAETKGGYEFFVNSKGVFFRMFKDILFKKSKESSILPEFDRIQLSVLEDGLFTLMFHYPSKSNSVVVKLYDSFGWAYQEPIIHKFDENERDMIEEHFTFTLTKNHDYVVMIYYEGQINTNPDGKEQCEYYNLAIGVNYLSSLKEDFKCIDNNNQYKNFRDIKKEVSDKDLDKDNTFKIQEYYVLNYPQDFKTMAYNQQGSNIDEERDLIVNTINVNLNDKFDFDSYILFDYPTSLFHLSMFTEDAPVQISLQSTQNSLFDTAFYRNYRQRDLSPNTNYPFGIYENMALNYLEYTQKHIKSDQGLCVYFYLHLEIMKKVTVPKAQVIPTVVSVSPMVEKNPMVIQKSNKELKVGIEFSEVPYVKKKQQNSELVQVKKSDFMNLASLNFYDHSGKAVIFSKKPSLISKDQESQSWSFVFNIQEEQKNKDFTGIVQFNLELIYLVNKENKAFILGKGISLPVFKLESIFEKPVQKKQAEETQSTIQSELKNITKNVVTDGSRLFRSRQEEIKCLCVHGECTPGEWACSKCENGWQGKLCDIEIKGTNINTDQDSPITIKSGRLTRNKQNQSNDFLTKDSSQKPNYEGSGSLQGSYIDETSFDFSTTTFTDLPKKISNFSFSKVLEFFWHLILIVIVILMVASLFYFLFNTQAAGRLRRYMPIAMNENEGDNEKDNKQMELTDLRSKSKKGKKKKGKVKLINEDEDEETKRLSSELMLYANDQDEAEMLQRSGEKPQERHGYEPQHVNEFETSHEIEAALQEIKYVDDDDDEASELRQYF